MLGRTVVIALALTACARGRSEEPLVDARSVDAATQVDAAAQGPDAPTSSSTCADAFAGTLATWNLATESGNQASTAATMVVHGITAGAITRSAGLTAVTGIGSINSSGWATTAQRDPAKYYAFTLAPPTGCVLAITGAMIDARSSGTGPVSASLSTSVDNYAAAATVSTTTAGTVAVTAMAGGMIEIRIYGYAASSSGGTFRLQNSLAITGELK